VNLKSANGRLPSKDAAKTPAVGEGCGVGGKIEASRPANGTYRKRAPSVLWTGVQSGVGSSLNSCSMAELSEALELK